MSWPAPSQASPGLANAHRVASLTSRRASCRDHPHPSREGDFNLFRRTNHDEQQTHCIEERW